MLAARLALEGGGLFVPGAAWWRSERRIRSAAWPPAGLGRPEVVWPDVPGSPYPDEVWAVEVELTPKGTGRTAGIMVDLLGRTSAWPQHGVTDARQPRYACVTYLCAPAALPTVQRAAAGLPARLAGRLAVQQLPDGALL
ncbi:MAG: hypothetical protein ACR2FU_01780 [Streptosporangiaceae bacterium]